MDKHHKRKASENQPGIWSTDDYIRTWALRQGFRKGVCLIPLQSLHDFWMARVQFDAPGQPVERFVAEHGGGSHQDEPHVENALLHRPVPAASANRV